jgi:iron complex outermembrane receptor protein
MISLSKLLAQSTIKGLVTDEETGEPVVGANIYVPETGKGTITANDGSFELMVDGAFSRLNVSCVGYNTFVWDNDGASDLHVKLVPAINLEEIVITGVRAMDRAPVAKTSMKTEEIEAVYIGQDVPFMLEQSTPSLISYSEAGSNFSNYGQFRLRGVDQSRVNITFDGAPLNDMIDQGVFFSNFTDLSNNVKSVQVQRGVGTSSNGTASFAGSINFESVSLNESKPAADLQLVGGSFNTYRANAAVNTGIMNNNLSFHASFNTFRSEGYRNHSSTRSNSFYFSGGYFGEKDFFKLNAFIGRSKNGLAYSPVAISDIEIDPKTNYINENDIDDFGQWLVQLQYTRLFNDLFSLSSNAYYGGAGGDYPFGFLDENEELVQINFPLTNDHIGLMSTLNYTSQNRRLTAHGGIHLYTFRRVNLENIVPDRANPYYEEHSQKDEVSVFAKANYSIGKFALYGDLQLRTLKLDIDPDETLLPDEPVITKNWSFLNPRIGLNYELDVTKNLYISYGRNGREPTKIDILGGFQLNPSNLESVKSDDVKPEYVNDFEAGFNIDHASFSGNANLFYMIFTDEIAPIGEFVPEGFIQLRKNMPNSFRRGIELNWIWKIVNNFSFSGNTTYMQSEIEEYAPEGEGQVYNNVTPALSPEWIFSGSLEYTFLDRFGIQLGGRYVGESYQEPTNDPRFIMPSFFVIDTKFSVGFGKGHSFDLFLNNVFDQQYFTYGAPVDVDWDGSFDEPGYFVQPPRNLYGKLVLKF